MEALVRTHANPCEIFGGKSDTGKGFLRTLRVSRVSMIPPMLHSLHIFIYMSLLLEGQMDAFGEPSKKQCSFGKGSAIVYTITLRNFVVPTHSVW